MKIALAFPDLPPSINGVGDYTALTARRLVAGGHDVTILCGRGPWTPIEGVRILQCMSSRQPFTSLRLLPAIRSLRPDWLVLQYASFAWGRWGVNPLLPFIARSSGSTRFALAAHENFPDSGPSLRRRAMSTAQRRQLVSLGKHADLVLFGTEPWAEMYGPWFPGTPVSQLPIASNLPLSTTPRDLARAHLGIDDQELVVGVFGLLGSGRNSDVLRAGLEAAARAVPDFVALYVGPSPAEFTALAQPFAGRVILLEAPPAQLAADAVACMDLNLAPFVGGVSRRRTTFLAALQHGVATVATSGPLVGPLLQSAAHAGVFALAAEGERPESFAHHAHLLASDPAARAVMGRRARTFYDDHLDAVAACDQLVAELERVGSR